MKSAFLAWSVSAGLAAGASHAALIDFTDSTVWDDPADTQTIALGGYATTVSLSAAPGAAVFTSYDGPDPVVEPLASSGLYVVGNPDTANDGVGVAPDDEITNPADRLTVAFSAPVMIEAFHFLDLFRPADVALADREIAEVYFDGELVFSFEFPGQENFATAQSGYFFADIAPRMASRVTFAAGLGNDLVGDPDYALAGIEIAPIPVPAAGGLLLAALGGLGLLRRVRR